MACLFRGNSVICQKTLETVVEGLCCLKTATNYDQHTPYTQRQDGHSITILNTLEEQNYYLSKVIPKILNSNGAFSIAQWLARNYPASTKILEILGSSHTQEDNSDINKPKLTVFALKLLVCQSFQQTQESHAICSKELALEFHSD